MVQRCSQRAQHSTTTSAQLQHWWQYQPVTQADTATTGQRVTAPLLVNLRQDLFVIGCLS